MECNEDDDEDDGVQRVHVMKWDKEEIVGCLYGGYGALDLVEGNIFRDHESFFYRGTSYELVGLQRAM